MFNKNLQSVRIQKLTSVGLTTAYDTIADAAVQLLGAHEIYYWGWGQQLMAKLSDGISFRMFRFASDFDTVAATAVPADAVRVE